MKDLHCSNCNALLPEDASFCAMCGTSTTSPSHTVTLLQVDEQETMPLEQERRTALAPAQSAFLPGTFIGGSSNRSNPSRPPQSGIRRSATVNASRRRSGRLSSASQPVEPLGRLMERDEEEELLTANLFEQRREVTWQKDVEGTYPAVLVDASPLPERPITPRPILLASPKKRRYFPSSLLFWVSTLVMLMLVLGGVFGVIITFGRGVLNNQQKNDELTLQITPSTLAVGGTMTLRGTNFTPNGQIGLTRDASIPLLDTGGTAIITADTHGNFTDTVVVGPGWEAGQHLINAEDAVHHKVAQFPVIVTGNGQSLRPAHLQISPATLDLGPGDLATNSTQILTLANVGGGQINWKASADQSWLQLSPQSGTLASSAQLTVAVDRADLQVGDYKANISIISNAGNMAVPVQMQVIPLQVAHEAALQLTPAVLSFTGVDGGPAPHAQTVTISNPGVLALQWSAKTSVSWLSLSPNNGGVDSGSSQQIAVNVDTSKLLPGTYRGVITVSGQGNNPVQDSPQNVVVNVTIQPQCTLQATPANLTFVSVEQQAPPAAQTVNIGTSQSCTAAMPWSVSSSANWLNVSNTSGTTPASPQVLINPAGLQPGTYNGALTFSSSAGTQTLPVAFTLAPPAVPLIVTTPSTMNFNGILGQVSPLAQTFTVTNNGGGTLNWQATGVTAVGGAWLNVAPATGSLTAGQSATVTISVTTLASLVVGTYNATITIKGTDGAGHLAGGSPQFINVAFVVQAACSLSATPTTLSFAGIVGQTTPPAAQSLAIAANGACANALTWTATAAQGTWLTATPVIGTASVNTPGVSSVSVSLVGLAAGTYKDTVTLTAIDSVTHAAIGIPQVVAVTLTVQPPCLLQVPSTSQLTFTGEAGSNPAAQTFTIGATGACSGAITLTPTVIMSNGTGWLAATPASATLTSGGNTTFTVTITSATLAAGTYNGSITLAATNGGVAIAGSPQTVNIALTVSAVPALTVAPASVTISVVTGTSTTPLTVSNTGGSSLDWKATLPANAPSFVSLSAGQGVNVSGGANQTLNVTVNATGLAGGSTYNISVTITAFDSTTGKQIGPPNTIPITITVAPPAIQLSTVSVTFTTPTGTNPVAQTVVLTNAGGDGLNWTVGTLSATWLTVSPTSGTTNSGTNASIVFNANVTGLPAGTYNATVAITPSTGSPVTVTVALTVTGATPTPTPSPSLTPTVSPTATAPPTPSPSPPSTPSPTPTP